MTDDQGRLKKTQVKLLILKKKFCDLKFNGCVKQ